jgi:hypothetical protein
MRKSRAGRRIWESASWKRKGKAGYSSGQMEEEVGEKKNMRIRTEGKV